MLRPIIVVSNRGPVSYDREDGVRVERRGGGGLVTALRGLHERHDVTWIASAMTDEDRVVAAEGASGVRLVAHDPRAYDLYYNVVANPLLWFIQHSLWGRALEPDLDAGFHTAWREGYERVNRAFADAVVAELDNTPDAVVWFHDYHLYLAPRFVRERCPGAVLGHFIHTPWPADWSVLPGPMRRAVHDGLLANDLVGFHTARWARNFRRSCEDEMGACDVRVASHAISIDAGEFDDLSGSERVLVAERALGDRRPEKLIVRVDRTDPSKNIVRGFHAFGVLLDRHPEWRGRVRMLARLTPSRERIPAYVAYRDAIDQAVQAVEHRHPGSIELEVADDFPRSVAAYKQYDVLLVNPVADGLNLVAKEGPLVNTRAGVLVLAETAGVHEELGDWALSVNPFDIDGQAEALHAALSMGEGERRRRAEAIVAHVRANDVGRWIADVLADLDALQA